MTKTSAFKTLFLDIGGILLTNGWGHESRQEAAQKYGFDYDEMNKLHHFIVDVYEIGDITLDEYLDTVVFHCPRDFTKAEFRNFMFSRSAALPGMLPWLKEWKKNCGLSVIALNNEGKALNQYRVRTFDLHQCFDAFVTSSEVGMRKPNPDIYRLAMGIAQALPEQCMYFDDRPMQVEVAKKIGMKSYHHQNFEATKEILENL